MAILSLAFLGPFTVSYDGHIVTEFRTRSVQALLVYLAVEEMASRLHQREALAELLWPGYPPGSARKNLRQALYELRRLIPEVTGENGAPAPLTLGTRDTLQINPDACFELDTARFTRLIHESSVEALRKAVELYRGEFLENFALPDSGDFETWAATWRGHFQREVLEALNHLTSAALDQNDFVQAEAYARRQLELDDLRETSVGQLMQALTGQGQRSAALIAFDKARSRLHDELGIEPGLELNELREQIQIGEISPSVKGHPLAIVNSSKPIKIKPTYLLPHPASPFIGRRTEVEEVKDLLNKADLRLLTLVGPGGIGKTRLSIQVATEVIDVFPDGVFFASLAPVHIAEGMIPALAKALDFSFYREEKRPRQQLMDFLRTKHLLLILDNFEHLIGNRGRELIAEVLSVAPSVKLLITSRVQLNMQGEQLYPVTGMRSVEVSEASKRGAVASGSSTSCAARLHTHERKCDISDRNLSIGAWNAIGAGTGCGLGGIAHS
jgi:DNA-binding SARP family transcriptional activator